MCFMLIVSAILKPARRAWSSSSSSQEQPGSNTAPRDLESGDPERERQRHGPGHKGKRDRGMPNPDDYDIFGNPWNSKSSSMESAAGPRSVRMPGSGDLPRALDARDDELPHPDAFDIDSKEEGVNPFAEPTPESIPPASPGLISLCAISTLELDYEDEDKAGDIGATTVARDFADSSAPSTAAPSPEVAPETVSPTPSSSSSSPPSSFSESLPQWLIARKATAGPRAPRFIEVDVDGLTIAPPDLDLVARQQELLERALMNARRGSIWHPDQECHEEPSRPGVSRNQTSHV